MYRKIIYIINPIAGIRTKKDLQQFIERKTTARQIPFWFFPSAVSGDYSFIYDFIKKEKITDVVIAGGDGTVNSVISSLMDFNINFGVIPCGSGNGLALSAGISTQPAKALETIFSGNTKPVDGIKVNNYFSCMLCGLGFDAQVAHEFAEQPKRGLRTYVSLISKNFMSASPYHFKIQTNNIRFSTEAYFISIANSNQFGNNFTIAPKALLSDGLLDIVIVKKIAKPLLLINVMKQVVGGQLQKIENSLEQPVIYFQTKELIITNNDKAPMHIDGDPADAPTEVKIKVLPKCFRLIVPC